MSTDESLQSVLTKWVECDEKLLTKLKTAARIRNVPAGQVVMSEGDSAKEVILILSGKVSVVVYSSNGHEVHLSTLGEGDWVGEMSVLSNRNRSAFVAANEQVRLASFAPDFFLACMEENGKFATAIARLLSSRVEQTSRRMFEFAVFSSHGRIYSEVIRRSIPGSDSEERQLFPAPSITELAMHLSVARETASRAISRLEKMQLLTRESDRWRILAPNELADLIT